MLDSYLLIHGKCYKKKISKLRKTGLNYVRIIMKVVAMTYDENV